MKVKLLVFISLFMAYTMSSYGQSNIMQGELYFEVNDFLSNQVSEFESPDSINTNIAGLRSILQTYGTTRIQNQSKGTFYPNGNEFFWLKFTDINQTNQFITDLTSLSEIENVNLVPKVFNVTVPPNDPDYPDSDKRWHLDKLNAESAWTTMDASANVNDIVVVAVIDNAFDIFHPDLQHNIWINQGEIPTGLTIPDINGNTIVDATEIIAVYGSLKIAFDSGDLFDGLDGTDNNGKIDDIFGWDVAMDDNDVTINEDDFFDYAFNWSHGTHTSGLISADTDNGIGTASIGRNVKILPIKIMENGHLIDNGSTTSGNQYFNALYYISSIMDEIDVINISSGMEEDLNNLEVYMQENIFDNAIVIASVGNDGEDSHRYPAAYNDILGIANSTPQDTRHASSNFGNWISVTAPGEDIWSLRPNYYTSPYIYMTGTSQAAPIVSGLAAVLKQFNPNMSNEGIENCILSTANPVIYDNGAAPNTMGTGIIDAEAALACVTEVLSLPPDVTFSSNFQNICLGTEIAFNWLQNNTDTEAPTNFLWDFGDGNTSTLAFPTHTYLSTGNYTVSLEISNNNGSDAYSYTDYITVNNGNPDYLSPNVDNNWQMANHNGIVFDGLEIQNTNDGAMLSAIEGGASISNNSGELLFYNDNHHIYNRFHQIMAEVGIFGSGTQNSVILPKPSSNCSEPSIYYLFYQSVSTDRLRVAIIDLSLNNGLGNVSEDLELTDYRITEHLTATLHCNSIDFWLIGHQRNNVLTSNYNFFHLPITESGLGTAVLQDVPSYGSIGRGAGEMKISPNKTLIGWNNQGYQNTYLYAFDSETGMIGAELLSMSDNWAYGFEFSPNSELFYIGNNSQGNLIQIDIATETSQVVGHIDGGIYSSSIQLARNGKIYWGEAHQKDLIQINNPNSIVNPNVTVDNNWFNANITYGKPQAIISRANIGNLNTFDLPVYIATCTSDPIELSIPTGFTNIIWSTGETSNSIFVTELGTYWVEAIDASSGCTINAETEIIMSADALTEEDIYICDGQIITLCADQSYGNNHAWSTGASSHCIDINQTDTYTCQTTNWGCTLTEVFNVVNYQAATINANIICPPEGSAVLEWNLEAQGDMIDQSSCTYAWSSGETTNPIAVIAGGYYKVTITNADGCEQIAVHEVPIIDNFSAVSPYDIHSDVTVSGGVYYVKMDINIENSSTLLLRNCTLYMYEGGYINIRPESELYNYSSVISGCSTWKGINVQGNPYSPSPNLPENACYKGRLGSTIEHASIALNSTSGGYISISNSYFKNNRQSIEALNENENGVWLSTIVDITETEFTIDNNQRFLSSLFDNLYQISFINVGNTIGFNCSIINNATDGTRLSGIYSNGAEICTFDGDYRTHLENLQRGIVKIGEKASNTSILNNIDIVNTLQGIYVESTDLTEFKNNVIDMSGSTSENAYGIYLNNCDAPEVLLNTFKNGARALLINQGEGDYTVYKNTFENFTYSPNANFQASAVVASGDNTYNNNNQGLQFKCNNFTNNTKSISVIEDEITGNIGKVKQEQGYWDLLNQNIKDPANNIFDGYCNTGDGNDAFYVESTSLPYTYYHHLNSNMNISTCVSAIVMTSNTLDYVTNFEEACPDDPNTGTGGGDPCIGCFVPSSMSTVGTTVSLLDNTIDTKETELNEKVDKGNTELLASEVNISGTTDYTEVAQKVSENEGYVSDLVLDEFITKDVGRPVAKAIALAQNSPLPEKAKGKIPQAGLPEDLETYLWTKQNGISKRVQKEREIAHLKNKKQYIFNYLMAEVLADSTLSKADSLIDLMDTQEDLNIRKQTIKLLSALGRKEEALQKVSELRQDIVNLDNMEQFDDVLQIESISINAKAMTEVEKISLYQSKRDLLLSIYHKKDKASVKAYRILKDLGEELEATLDVKIAFPKADNNRIANASTQANSVKMPNVDAWLSLYPNPVKGKLTVEYLFAEDAHTEMRIYDINGKLLMQQKFNTHMGIKSIDVSKLTTGVYIFKLDNHSKEFVVK